MEEKEAVGKDSYTREEVENIISQVNNQARIQCEKFAKRCTMLEEQLMYRRLDYLFKVIDNPNSNYSLDFIKSCANEIMDALTIKNTEE